MAAKRQTKGDELANEVELAAFLLDNEADLVPPELMASELTHMSVDFEPQTLPLTSFLQALAAQLRETADRIRRMR
jgi:hypothetical protein